MKEKATFYTKYILPGVILQSVLIGGGYATGREIYQYGGLFGAKGWIAGITIAIGFALFSFLTFELCRIHKVYDYKSFTKKIIGPLWPVMDILTILISILLIAVMAAATASIFTQVGLPSFLGSLIVIIIVGLLNFFGDRIIEQFESIGTVLLYIGYIIFTIIVISRRGEHIGEVFAENSTVAYDGNVTVALCIWTGILYVAYNIICMQMGMFTLKRQTSRKHTFWAGIVAGALMVIPWFLSYFAMMCFYGDLSIVGPEVETPWTAMITAVNGGPVLLALFGLVMGWTLIETATGCIHMIIDRFDKAIKERKGTELSKKARGIAAVVVLVSALLLSRIGIVDLIGAGYSALSYGFIIFYLLPVLCIGGYQIIKYKGTDSEAE